MADSKKYYAEKIENYYSKTDPQRIFFLDQPTLSEKYSPLYGELFAKKLIKLIKQTGFYNVVELGAGLGVLAKDIQDYIKKCEPEIYERLRYFIIDFSFQLCVHQKKMLKDYNVYICNGDATNIPLKCNAIEGIFIANEMIADLPFDKSDNVWNRYGIEMFIKEIKRVLRRGIVIIIEYGRRSKSILNLLGDNKSNHYELAIDFNALKISANKEFDSVNIMTLEDYFEQALKTNIFYRILFEIIPSSILLLFKKKICYGKGKLSDEIEDDLKNEISYLNEYTVNRAQNIKNILSFICTGKINDTILKIILNGLNLYDRWHIGMRAKQKLNDYRDAFACVIMRKEI